MTFLLAGCNQAHVQGTQAYGGPPLATPQRVIVAYFAIAPEDVQLDQGIRSRIQRLASDQPMTAEQLQVARQTQAAIADELVNRLRSYGLPAEIGSASPTPARNLMVVGQIVSVDQGNRTRRVVIGLGAGKSSVGADVQLYYATSNGAPPRFLAALQGEADSGHAPGAAETMGVGAAAGTMATSAAMSGAVHGTAEVGSATSSGEAARLADGIARQIGQFAVAQGWIQPAAVR